MCFKHVGFRPNHNEPLTSRSMTYRLVLLGAMHRIQQDSRVSVSHSVESKYLAPSDYQLAITAVRRLAYDAADVGPLSPTWRPVFAGFRVPSGWVCGSVSGSVQIKPKRCCSACIESC